MKPVSFNCRNCGRTVEEEILRSKYAILGTVPELNRTQGCCEKPAYVDEEGVYSSGGGLRELLGVA